MTSGRKKRLRQRQGQTHRKRGQKRRKKEEVAMTTTTTTRKGRRAKRTKEGATRRKGLKALRGVE
jgi:hypothetical protein